MATAAKEPRQLKPAEAPVVSTLRVLYEMRIELEKKLAAGPWDQWDEALLVQWMADVKEQIRAAESALCVKFDSM